MFQIYVVLLIDIIKERNDLVFSGEDLVPESTEQVEAATRRRQRGLQLTRLLRRSPLLASDRCCREPQRS